MRCDTKSDAGSEESNERTQNDAGHGTRMRVEGIEELPKDRADDDDTARHAEARSHERDSRDAFRAWVSHRLRKSRAD